MGQENPLINIDTSGLTEPAKLLIKKISKGCGILYEPIGIVRQAKAEVEEKKIQALGDIELSEIKQRTVDRLIQEETIKQQNVENIIRLALPQLEENSNPNKIDNDWLHNFFEKSKLISDEEMRTLWAKILAGEANKPQTYSKRTVHCIAEMDKNDAKMFSNLCSFQVYSGTSIPLIYDDTNEIYTKNGIDFSALKHLEYIGLITFNELTSFIFKKQQKKIKAYYYDIAMIIEFSKEDNNDFNVGKIMFTKTGKELAQIAGGNKQEGFIEYLLTKWKDLGFKASLL